MSGDVRQITRPRSCEFRSHLIAERYAETTGNYRGLIGCRFSVVYRRTYAEQPAISEGLSGVDFHYRIASADIKQLYIWCHQEIAEKCEKPAPLLGAGSVRGRLFVWISVLVSDRENHVDDECERREYHASLNKLRHVARGSIAAS
jgi:hypothetical protein